MLDIDACWGVRGEIAGYNEGVAEDLVGRGDIEAFLWCIAKAENDPR